MTRKSAQAARTDPHDYDEGIVLRVTEFRETDRIVLLYTRDQGKISALARHAIKSRRRFGTQLNIFQLLRLRLKRKAHRQLAFLEEVRPLATIGGIYRDWRRIAAACVVADLVNEMTREGNANPQIYRLCREALLGIHGEGDWLHWLVSFEYGLLEATGYRPAVESCVSCHRSWTPGNRAYWVHGAGGIHCQGCLPNGAAFEILPAKLREPLAQLAQGQRVTADEPACAALLYAFIRYQLGRPILAWQFLEEMGLVTESVLRQ